MALWSGIAPLRNTLRLRGHWDMLEAHHKAGRNTMAWTTPKIEEVTCGMEINMYFPAEDDPVLF